MHRGRWALEDRVTAPLRELPVEVPPGCAALTVELSYEGGVIDLGCHGPAGFRGWSGGARQRFTIAPDWATPGYIPGELEPGLWHVWLGLHRVTPEGVPYEVVATPSDVAPPAPEPDPFPPVQERPSRTEPPAPAGMRWMAGDLHAHTVHSDGTLTVPELAHLAAGEGLDFLAVTDHNTVSHHAALPAAQSHSGVVLVPGQEVTTELGHANVFGGDGPADWVDFRRPATAWAEQAAARGQVMSINHPLSGDTAWRRPIPETGSGEPRLAEIWHTSWWDRHWGAPLAWARLWRHDLVPVGGSDFHDPAQGRPLGSPVTWVLAEDGDVLGALAAGRTAIAESPKEGTPLLLRVEDELIVLGAEGAILVRPDGHREVVRGDHVRIPASDQGMHHLESHDNEVIALCG